MMRIKVIALLLFIGLAGCSPEPEQVVEAPYDPARDYYTFSNYEQFTTRHMALDLDVDFEAEELRGSVTLFMSRLDPAAHEVILDTRDVHIGAVRVSESGQGQQEATFSIGERHALLGQPLVITLPEGFEPAGEFELTIDYRTDPSATALQWLPPELTSGGEYPLLFSQSQNIHARSWIPLQDTPAANQFPARLTTTGRIHGSTRYRQENVPGRPHAVPRLQEIQLPGRRFRAARGFLRLSRTGETARAQDSAPGIGGSKSLCFGRSVVPPCSVRGVF